MLVCLHDLPSSRCYAENPDDSPRCWRCHAPLDDALRVYNPGAHIQHYRVTRIIGHGSFGAIYEVEDTYRPGARLALKETLDQASIQMFQAEFAVLRTLQHDSLPRYYNTFEWDGRGFLVMEHVPGQSLQDVLEKTGGPLPEQQVMGYCVQLCEVLDYLHHLEPPLFHRDVKPANVRLTPDGLIKLVDFGLLKTGTDTTRSNLRGAGTPEYAPIEQFGGGHTDVRSDIYSLGATFYHLLTGELPAISLLRTTEPDDPLVTPDRFNPRLSQYLVDVLLKAMSIEQQDRYQDMDSFKAAMLGIAIPKVIAPRRVEAAVLSGEEARSTTLVRTLSVHTEGVTSVAWSPDGQMLASAGGHTDRMIRLWRVRDGALTGTLRGHTDGVTSVAWSPDGQFLISGSVDKTARLWVAVNGSAFRTLEGHQQTVAAVSWAADDKTVASAGEDETICVWRVPMGKLRTVFRGHKAFITSIAYSPDGKYIASTGGDRTVRVWRLLDNMLIAVLEGHTATVTDLAWHSESKTLVSAAEDHTVRLWDFLNGTCLKTFETGDTMIESVSYHPNGAILACAHWDHIIRFWNIESGEILQAFEGHTNVISSIAFSPDGKLLASGSWDKSVRIWDAKLKI